MSCQIKFHVVDRFLCQNNPLDFMMIGCFCFFLNRVYESDVFLKTLILKAIFFLIRLKCGRRVTNLSGFLAFVKIIYAFPEAQFVY